MEHTQIKDLVTEIVRDFNPRQLKTLNEYSEKVISSLEEGNGDEWKSIFEFDAGTVKTIVECISILVGTFKIVKELNLGKKKGPSEEETKAFWKQSLVDEGISMEKAEMIVQSKFYRLKNLK